MTDQQFFAPCPRGLEAVLADELSTFGARSTRAAEGGVGFAGDFHLCYRVNMESRLASRVLWQVGSEVYRTEQDVHDIAKARPWEHWFAPTLTIRVNVAATGCPLRSLDFVTLRIKDAVCDRFRERSGSRPSVDTAAPDVRIHAYLDAASVTLYLDTSGEALFKRGYRRAGGEAPLRENLAAGILRLAGWTPGTPLLDPMCGSGTFLLEAAQIALDIPPGLGRRFGFERLANFEPDRWRLLREEARDRRRPHPDAPELFGSDRSRAALDAAGANLAAAGVAASVGLMEADVGDIGPPAAEGILVTNPPYGVRMGDDAELEALYPRLGTALKQRFAGWRACIFTSDLRLPKLIGLKPSRRTPLYNGALECRLYEFRMVAGSMRRVRSEQ